MADDIYADIEPTEPEVDEGMTAPPGPEDEPDEEPDE